MTEPSARSTRAQASVSGVFSQTGTPEASGPARNPPARARPIVIVRWPSSVAVR
jgi:hypothetical protein